MVRCCSSQAAEALRGEFCGCCNKMTASFDFAHHALRARRSGLKGPLWGMLGR